MQNTTYNVGQEVVFANQRFSIAEVDHELNSLKLSSQAHEGVVIHVGFDEVSDVE